MSFMVSLASNPYSPFTQYDSWKKFDEREGYDTNGLFARALSTSSSLSEAEQLFDQLSAAQSIADNPSFGGVYVVVNSDHEEE